MKRSWDKLIPFEERILDAMGEREMYGMEIADAIGLSRQKHGLATLYRALHRLAGPKLNRLESRLESARIAEREKRPRRRLYRRTRAAAQEDTPT